MDLNNLCRLCLCKSQIFISLLENDGISIVESITSIKIEKNDNLPSGACVKCWLNIRLAYRIQQNIIEADAKLRQIVSENNEAKSIDIKVEDVFSEEIPENSDNLCDSDYNNKNFESWSEEVALFLFKSKCSICGDQVNDKEANNHLKDHFNQPQKCGTCNIELENTKSHQFHLSREHPEEIKESFKCGKCPATFKYKSLFVIHSEKAHYFLTLHKRDEKDSKEEILECDNCQSSFSDKKSLQKHVKMHEIKLPKPCPICNIKIGSNNFHRHVKMHSSPTTVCHLCGAVLKNALSLRSHIFYTHSTRSYTCKQCDQVFNKKFLLTRHVTKKHIGEKNFTCEECGKAFFTNTRLKSHKETHSKSRNFICQYCKKAFSRKFALQTHVRQHTNEAPYKCDICGEGFRQNISMRSHKKSKHNFVEELTVSCKECGKKFASDFAVLAHMRLHL